MQSPPRQNGRGQLSYSPATTAIRLLSHAPRFSTSLQLHGPRNMALGRRRHTDCVVHATATGLLGLPQQTPLQYHVRPAHVSDGWAIARVHCDSFYPDAGLLTPLLRLDRVFALQTGVQAETRGVGAYRCLVACCSSEDEAPAALLPEVKSDLLPARLQGWLHKVRGDGIDVLGAIVVDTQGAYIPPRRVRIREFVRHEKRKNIAYISCLAVAPAARRQGVATKLIQQAEQLALSWGCRMVALHYDIKDEAIFGLYDSLGYRRAIYEPSWAPYVMGRPGTRLCLMLKLLKPSAKALPAPSST